MSKREAPEIKTGRLLLRKKQEEDIPSMLRLFNNEEVREYLGGYPPRDERSMLRMVSRRTETEWAVVLKETNSYIGECLISKIVDGYLGEIGYFFMREYWGFGYAAEAAEAVMAYAFNTLRLGRLYAEIDNRNERSKRLIERLGFTQAALLPEADFGGRVCDVAYYTRIKCVGTAGAISGGKT
jgi:ribosomal-protein-alanine N-acetyltransferase